MLDTWRPGSTLVLHFFFFSRALVRHLNSQSERSAGPTDRWALTPIQHVESAEKKPMRTNFSQWCGTHWKNLVGRRTKTTVGLCSGLNSLPGRSQVVVSLFILPAGFNQFLSVCSIYLPTSNTDPQPWREIRSKRCITGLQSYISLYFLPLFLFYFFCTFWQAIKTSVSPASSLQVWYANYLCGAVWRLQLHNEGSGMWLNTAGWGSGEVVFSQQLSLKSQSASSKLLVSMHGCA